MKALTYSSFAGWSGSRDAEPRGHGSTDNCRPRIYAGERRLIGIKALRTAVGIFRSRRLGTISKEMP